MPYVSYEDQNATVIKFDGTSWLSVGISAVVASNIMIYVLYDDHSADTNLTVMKYDNPVNKTGLTPAIIDYLLD